MDTKLKNLSEKSLISLVWKQRNVINAFARQIKALLADKQQYVPVAQYNQLERHYENLKFICEQQNKAMNDLNNRLVKLESQERSLSNER